MSAARESGHIRVSVSANRTCADIASPPERHEQALKGIPLRRYAVPEEIASCALFLASDDASFVAGTFLMADSRQTIM